MTLKCRLMLSCIIILLHFGHLIFLFAFLNRASYFPLPWPFLTWDFRALGSISTLQIGHCTGELPQVSIFFLLLSFVRTSHLFWYSSLPRKWSIASSSSSGCSSKTWALSSVTGISSLQEKQLIESFESSFTFLESTNSVHQINERKLFLIKFRCLNCNIEHLHEY